jgi:energy-coupling factor transporter ATP-binding protein EcfA2
MEANKQVVSLVCIGKTGAGKTTLINTLMNHVMKKSYHDERVIAITQLIELRNPMTEEQFTCKYECNLDQFQGRQSDRLGSGSTSQTTNAHIYDINLGDFTLKIIDTPGLADTTGMEQDKKNIEVIVKGIREVSKIDGILFVQKSTEVRLDISLKYLISEIQGMLPKGCEGNFFTCLTAVVNKLKLDVLPALKEMKIPVTNLFTFENDALVHPEHLREVAGIDTKDFNSYEELTAVPEAFWKQNRAQANKLIELARRIKPFESRSVLDLHNKRKFQITLVHEEAHRCDQLEEHKASIEAKKLRNLTLRDLLLQNSNYDTTGMITVMKTTIVSTDNGMTIRISSERVRGNIDHNMKQIYEDSEKSIKQIENEIKRHEAEIAHFKDHIDSCYRIMIYLQGMIEKHAMRATNEYYEEYSDAIIKNMYFDASLTDIEKSVKRSRIDQAIKEYRLFKKLAKASNELSESINILLSTQEKNSVETRLQQIEQEEIEAVQMKKTLQRKNVRMQQQKQIKNSYF